MSLPTACAVALLHGVVATALNVPGLALQPDDPQAAALGAPQYVATSPEAGLDGKEHAACGRAALPPQPQPGDGPLPRESDADTDVLHYLLDIELIPELTGPDITAVRVEGTSTITARSLVSGLSTFTVDLLALLNVTSVAGDAVSFVRPGNTIVITLDRAYDAGEEFQISVNYDGYPAVGGLGAFVWWLRNGNLAVATLSEPYYARYWWPCKDSLGDKATMQMHCTVPDGLVVASNGISDGIEALPGGRVKHKWHEVNPMVPYLASLAVTNYQIYNIGYNFDIGNGPGTMPVLCYLYPDHWDFGLNQPLPAHMAGCDELLVMLDKFGQRFGPYPFLDEKYGVAETGGGLGANMEHQTISSMWRVDNYSDIMAHELAHHWWGDEVTCATWYDIWLNEGFASYAECLYREIKPGGGISSYWSRVNARRPGDPDARVYRTSIGSAGAIFSTNDVYNKGCWILHMLRHVMGDDAFFDAIADYRSAYADSFATTAQFSASISSSFGIDLGWFVDQWIMNPGSPDYEWSYANQTIEGQDYLKLLVRQSQNLFGFGLITMPVDIRVTTANGATVHRIWNDAWTEHYVLKIGGAPISVEFDEAAGVDTRNHILGGRVQLTEVLAAPPVLVDAEITVHAPAAQTLVHLAFSEDIASFDAADVEMAGALTGPLAPGFVAYNPATQTADIAWSLLPNDEYTLTILSAGITANAVNLDGEVDDDAWYDDVLLPSGDGQPGGDAILTFSILAGDADCDGSVTTGDIDEFVAVLIGDDIDVCHALRADMDNSGIADGADLQPFVDALLPD